MTMISLRYPRERITPEQRRDLATRLTDAVLEVECGKITPAARFGFQVHFQPFDANHVAIGGQLLDEHPPGSDVMVVDIAVMDGDWPAEARQRVLENTFDALCAGLGVDRASPTWWVNFRVIEEGSWGSRGGVLSILDLLDTGAFSEERAAAIRAAIPARERPL